MAREFREAVVGCARLVDSESETLGEYLDWHADTDLRAVQMREFDAPGDYRIGAWLDPANCRTPKLPNAAGTGRGSWFFT